MPRINLKEMRMDQTKWNEIHAVILFAIALLIFISLVSFTFSDLPQLTSHPNVPVRNFAGLFGVYVGGVLFFIMGMSSYVIPLLILSWAVARLFGVTPQKIYFKASGTFFMILASSSLFSIMGQGDNPFRFTLGGIVGLAFSDFLIHYLGRGGAILVIGVLFLLSLLLATEFLLLPFLARLYRKVRTVAAGDDEEESAPKRRDIPVFKAKKPLIRTGAPERSAADPAKGAAGAKAGRKEEEPKAPPAKREPIVIKGPLTPPPPPPKPAKKAEREPEKKLPVAAPVEQGEYKMPATDLLDTPPPIEAGKLEEELKENARILEETLREFEIEAKVTEINKGPIVTRYELEPAPGVKIQRISSLGDNIALAMKAESIIIEAPVPGKGTVGFQIPNSVKALVSLRDVIESKEYRESKAPLKLALGKDIAGTPVVADLTTMPHLLVAGATGAGKTVCINGIIASILYSSTPEEVKFIMIDPKRVELAVYNELPHLLAPVVTESKKAANVLEWVVNEMDERYKTFAEEGARNIAGYNQKMVEAKKFKLPYIVVIVDELADLMMISQAEVEAAIVRLAQLARATGIHLIIATQRPSVDVITGLIKANFPARISFKVASKVDSRTVIDANGADQLLGRGDMLFIQPGASRPVRAQCSLISDKEIERITQAIKAQRGPNYASDVVAIQKATAVKKFEKDEVYEEAVKFVLESRQASVSVLQRRLGVGYQRAGRLMDMMEEDGVVGPYQGSKPRDVLTTLEEYQARGAAAGTAPEASQPAAASPAAGDGQE